jgi:alpha-L-fucosidase
MLVDIVAKGGNYLLNVGPQPDGQLPAEAVERLREIGAWMKVNGEAIYASRAVPPYRAGKFRYTRLKNGDVYAIYLPDKNETRLPAKLEIPGPAPRAGTQLALLGSDATLAWERVGDQTVVDVPAAIRQSTANAYAWAIRLPGAAANQ